MKQNLKSNTDILPGSVCADSDDSILEHLEGNMAYRLTNAYLFVAVLQKDNEALCSLIAALLHKKREEIISVEILNPIIPGQEIDLKTCVLDLLVLLNNNARVNIEMQVSNENNWDDRSVYYLARKLPELSVGSDYRNLKPFFQIGILDFNYPADNKEFYQDIRLMNVKTHKIYSDKVSIHVLCLPMIESATPEDRSSGLYFWAKVFQATTWKELKKLAENNTSFKKTIVTMAQLSEDEKIRRMCEARERYDLDMSSSFGSGYDLGKAEDSAQLLQLGEKLKEAGRFNELLEALKNKEYRKQLLEEFGLSEE